MFTLATNALKAVAWVLDELRAHSEIGPDEPCKKNDRLRAFIEATDPDMTLAELCDHAEKDRNVASVVLDAHLHDFIRNNFDRGFLVQSAFACAHHENTASALRAIYGDTLPPKVEALVERNADAGLVAGMSKPGSVAARYGRAF